MISQEDDKVDGWCLAVSRKAEYVCVWEGVSRFRRLENVDAVFQLCSNVVLAMFLTFFARYVAQRQCDEHGYRNRHANAHQYELIVDAAVRFSCKDTKTKAKIRLGNLHIL